MSPEQELEEFWGTGNVLANLKQARYFALKYNLPPHFIDALENELGFVKTMELFRHSAELEKLGN